MAVIMMTAFASVEDAVTCINVGAFDYIIKPFPPEKLTNLIEHIFGIIALKKKCQNLETQSNSIKKWLDDYKHLLLADDAASDIDSKDWGRLRKDLNDIIQEMSEEL